MRHRNSIVRAALAAAALLACAMAGNAQERPLQGSWRGVGVQSEGRGDIGTWQVRVTFDGERAQVSYPSLRCSGTWTRDGGGWRERITTGNCISNGRITLHRQDGKLFMNWTVEGLTPDIAAAAVLFPSGPIA